MIRNLIRLMEIFSFVYAFAAVYGKKVRYNIYLVVFVLAELVLLSGINDRELSPYLLGVSYLMMLFYCMVNYQSSVKETIVNCVMGFAVVSFFQIISYMIISIVVELGSFATLQKESIVSLAYTIIIIGFAKKMHLDDLSKFFLKRNKLLSMIGIFVLIVLGSQIVQMKRMNLVDAQMMVLVISFILLFAIIIYEWDKTRKDVERKKLQMEMNKLYYGAYEGLIQTIREKQHDFKNHINAIEGMLYSIDDSEKIIMKQKDYLKGITYDADNIRLLTMIENPIIAGFLNYEVSRARELEITVNCDCIFSDGAMKISEFEIVEMFGILVDNAIEAVSLREDDKLIDIRLSKTGEEMCFSVSNPLDKSEFDNVNHYFENGYSSKGKNRGIGLSKLKRLVDKYNGEIVISQEDKGIFMLKIEIILCV